jgi:hypothetical protein
VTYVIVQMDRANNFVQSDLLGALLTVVENAAPNDSWMHSSTNWAACHYQTHLLLSMLPRSGTASSTTTPVLKPTSKQLPSADQQLQLGLEPGS